MKKTTQEAIRISLSRKDENLLRVLIQKKGTKPSGPNVMKEVQEFLTKTLQDTNKALSQENFKKIYESMLSKFNDFEAQKKFQESVGEIGNILNSLSSTSIQQSISNVFNQFFEQVEQPLFTHVNKQDVKQEVKQEKVVPSSRLIKDITLEDGSEVEIGKDFTKVWKIKNTGKTSWPEGTCLVYLGGSEMGITIGTTFVVKLAKPDEEVDVSVTLKANANGVLEGNFRLRTKEEEFGNKLFFKVISKKQEIKQEKWTSELIFLHDMGFTDDKLNVSLLEKYQGNLTTVVQNILGN